VPRKFSNKFLADVWLFPSAVSCQVQKREKKNPDDVHEVPVEAGDLDRCKMAGCKFSNASEKRQNQHQENSYCDVNCVETRHREIQPEKNLGVSRIRLVPFEIQNRHQMAGPILVILDAFQNHENDSEKGRAQ